MTENRVIGSVYRSDCDLRVTIRGQVPGIPTWNPGAAPNGKGSALNLGRAVAQTGSRSVSARAVAGRDDFPNGPERRLAVGFGRASAQSRLQAGASVWLRHCRAAPCRGLGIRETADGQSTPRPRASWPAGRAERANRFPHNRMDRRQRILLTSAHRRRRGAKPPPQIFPHFPRNLSPQFFQEPVADTCSHKLL